jgi:hypothetical protein
VYEHAGNRGDDRDGARGGERPNACLERDVAQLGR